METSHKIQIAILIVYYVLVLWICLKSGILKFVAECFKIIKNRIPLGEESPAKQNYSDHILPQDHKSVNRRNVNV